MKALLPLAMKASLVLVAPICASSAMAQDVGNVAPSVDSVFARDRSVTVTERMIPGYDRPGVDVGVFNLRPQLLVSGFFSDNLYATKDNATSDVAVIITPTINAVADLQNTKIGLGGTVQFARFASRGSENNTVYQTRGTLEHDFGSGFKLNGEFDYERQAERRSDPGAVNTSITPIAYNIARVGAGAEWEGGRLRLVGTGSYSNLNFKDGETADGTTLSQRYRDRNLLRLGGLADYAISPDFALRGQINFAKSDYNRPDTLNPIDRSSDRVEVLGGTSFEFTDFLRGELGVGYISQRYTNNGLRGFSGIGGRGQIEYLASPLTTFTFRASRTVEEAGLAQSPTFIRTIASLTVDHELYRNLIISGYGGYSTDRFSLPTRSDHRPVLGVSGIYRMSRNLSVVARYDYLKATSAPTNSLREFSLNTVSIGINVGI